MNREAAEKERNQRRKLWKYEDILLSSGRRKYHIKDTFPFFSARFFPFPFRGSITGRD